VLEEQDGSADAVQPGVYGFLEKVSCLQSGTTLSSAEERANVSDLLSNLVSFRAT